MSATATPSDLLAVGLNPAWQKMLFFDDVELGQVNRATAVLEQASGKGTNFATAIRQLGGQATVAQFAGGTTGERLCADQERRGIRHLTVTAAAVTRTCTTLASRAGQSATELIEPSGAVSAAEFNLLRERVLGGLSAWRGVALCGTFPPGVPATFYAEIAHAARPRAIVLLDAFRNINETLKAAVDVLKINATELRELTHKADVADAARALLAAYPVTWLAVTAGPDAAHLFRAGSAWAFELPRLEQVVNPIGAGDCVAGAFLWLLLHPGALGESRPLAPPLERARALAPENVVAAYREALACGSASCLEPTPGSFVVEKARDLAALIRVRTPQTEPRASASGCSPSTV